MTVSFQSMSVTTALSAVVAVGAAVALTRYLVNKLTSLRLVGTVDKLIIYPFKGLKGIELEEAEVTPAGLRYKNIRDRYFGLTGVDGGDMICLYDDPSLALIRTSVDEKDLIIEADDMEPLHLPLDHTTTGKEAIRREKIIAQEHEGTDCGDEAAHWFQRYTGKSDIRVLRFLRHASSKQEFGKSRRVLNAFHGKRSFHVLSKASVNDLNSRMEEPVSYKNFRPNFLIEDCEPYSEDHWKELRIGKDAMLTYNERNQRCLVTGVNPETGIRPPGDPEPLKTLRKYRVNKTELGKKMYLLQPLFGTFSSCKKPGVVRVNDPVYALVSKNPLP